LIDIHISGTLSQSSWTSRFSSNEDWCHRKNQGGNPERSC